MPLSRLFQDYLALEPEEATTLGSDVGIDRLRDNTEEGLDRRARFFRDALRALEDDDDEGALTDEDADEDAGHDDALDRAAFARLARFELHLAESRWHGSNPEWALYPYTMLRLMQSTGGGDVRPRASKVASYLAADAARLRRGLGAGHVAHRSLLGYVRDALLPAAARFFEPLAPDASDAYRAHIALYDELLAAAPEDGSLGVDEYERRWALSFDLDESPVELAARAREELVPLHEQIVDVARSLAGGTHVRDFADATRLARSLQEARLPEGADVRAHYRGILERVCAFVTDRGLFDVEGALAELGMDDYPPGLRDLGAGTNWPAPLLRPAGRGQFVVHPDPGAHPAAWASVLAIHEGIPGHFLQSWHWQRRFGGSTAPLRFLCVADDVAIPRGYFGAMLNIEGYAVYAEERMRAAGFHEGEGALFALVGHAIRAARVVGDVELHRRTMTPEQVASFVAESTGLPDGAARMEAERYARGPLQAVTYFAGASAFASLAARAAEAADFDPAAFHAWLFSFGPAQPADIGRALERRSTAADL